MEVDIAARRVRTIGLGLERGSGRGRLDVGSSRLLQRTRHLSASFECL